MGQHLAPLPSSATPQSWCKMLLSDAPARNIFRKAFRPHQEGSRPPAAVRELQLERIRTRVYACQGVSSCHGLQYAKGLHPVPRVVSSIVALESKDLQPGQQYNARQGHERCHHDENRQAAGRAVRGKQQAMQGSEMECRQHLFVHCACSPHLGHGDGVCKLVKECNQQQFDW